MASNTVKLEFEKETKNTYQYKVDDKLKETAPITVVYVKKDALDGRPEFLEVTYRGCDK